VRRDRRCRGVSVLRVLVATAALAALVGVLFLAAARGQRGGRGTMPISSFRPDDSGLLAARLVLEEIGLPVASRRGARLPPGTGNVLIRVAVEFAADGRPPEEKSQSDKELAAWVLRGNGLLLLSSLPSTSPAFPSVQGADDADEPMTVAIPDEAKRLLAGAGPAVPESGEDTMELHDFDGLDDPWLTSGLWVSLQPGDELLVREPYPADVARIVERLHGEGRTIVVSDPWFATNVRLARSDNAAWLAELVSRLREGGTVYFDDRAVGQVASRGVVSLLTERGLGPALACVVVLLLLVWWRNGPSDAVDRHAAPPREYHPESYAHLRAGLYAECMTGAEIHAVVRDEVRRRLSAGDRTGMERALDMFATRHPERADAIRDALAELPADRKTSFRDHPAVWTRAVAMVWRALDDARAAGGRPSNGET